MHALFRPASELTHDVIGAAIEVQLERQFGVSQQSRRRIQSYSSPFSQFSPVQNSKHPIP